MAATHKQPQLDQIKADILAKNICPDLAKQATQLVFGDGNPDADIVFIGEAPGKNEDVQGVPFVGAAGKFLDEMLASIGLERKDIYITNIVKYRPPNNRDPLPDEKAAFLPFLRQQIEVIQPKLIVTLGRHSMDVLLPGLKISQVHGQPKRIRVKFTGLAGHQGADTMQGDGEKRTDMSSSDQARQSQAMAEVTTQPYKSTVKGVSQPATQQRAASNGGVGSSADEQAITSLVILPLFHPAAALYNGGMRQTLLDDFSAIPTILDKIETTT